MEYSLTFTIDNGVAQSAYGSLLWNLELDDDASDYYDDDDDDDDLSIGGEEIVVRSYEDLRDSMMATVQRLLAAHRSGSSDEGVAVLVPTSGAAVVGLEKRAFHATAEERGAVTGCAICLENFCDGEEVTVMPCSHGHEFHPDCITKWLGKSNTCPLCRHALPTEVMDDDEDL